MKSREPKGNAVQKSPTRTNVRQPLPHEQGGRGAHAPTRPPLATRDSKAVQQKPSQARPAAAPRTRETAAPAATRASTPAAPPVYRPQPTPVVLQRKEPPGRPTGRANQTLPSPAANVTRRPAAPPVYRPQSAPKVLQAKPALPQATAPRTPKAEPRVVLRQSPAPPAAPRATPHPAAPARPRPAAPARSGVLQLMEIKHGSGSDDDEAYNYEADIATQAALWEKSRNEKAELKKDREEKATMTKSSKSSASVETPPSNYTTSEGHLKQFDKDKQVLKSGQANQVTIMAKAGDSPVTLDYNGTDDNDYDQIIKSPSNDNCVTDTVNDGEVPKLQAAMRAFIAFLKRPGNQKKPQTFTVALKGKWGACDGCKQRIETFAHAWEREARKYMKKGVRATLKITYQYDAPVEGIQRGWGFNYYGWASDGKNAPLHHTVETYVDGVND